MPKVTLNPSFEAYQGRLGNIVYQEGREGVISRERVVPANPRTPAQTGARTAFTRASAAYKGLASPQLIAWTAYAKTINRRGRNGKMVHPAPGDLFVALGSKYLQVNPTGSIPLLPPATSFAGDTITVTATGAAGKVTFTASGANVVTATTELLLESLKSKNRVPAGKAYRTKAFQVFAAGTLSKDVTVPAGVYAPAIRFVNPTTGQVAGFTALPNVTVT